MSDSKGGSDALIHLRVPASMKARWVRESRNQGMKLTDWIVGRVERKMNVFKIPDSLANQYHGAGWALAAVAGGQLVTLRYVSDVAPDPVAEAVAEGGQHAGFFVRQWLQTAEAAPVVRELQALGDVVVGMCSAWEFCEL